MLKSTGIKTHLCDLDLNNVVVFPHINLLCLSNVVVNHVFWQKIVYFSNDKPAIVLLYLPYTVAQGR